MWIRTPTIASMRPENASSFGILLSFIWGLRCRLGMSTPDQLTVPGCSSATTHPPHHDWIITIAGNKNRHCPCPPGAHVLMGQTINSKQRHRVITEHYQGANSSAK